MDKEIVDRKDHAFRLELVKSCLDKESNTKHIQLRSTIWQKDGVLSFLESKLFDTPVCFGLLTRTLVTLTNKRLIF